MTRATRCLNEIRTLMHITGSAGSGKTTLMKQLQTEYPHITFKDTDDFASNRQLQNWHNKQEKDVVYCGLTTDSEGKSFFDLPEPEQKVCLKRFPLRTALQATHRLVRDARESEFPLPIPTIKQQMRFGYKSWQQARKDQEHFTAAGYEPKRADEIRQLLNKLR